MFIRKMFLFAVIVFLFGFSARENLRLGFGVRQMAIPLSRIREWANDKSFQTVYFNTFYDKKLFGGQAELVAYKQGSGPEKEMLDTVKLETTKVVRGFKKEHNYAQYKLDGNDLRIIVEHFKSEPADAYVLFDPVPYKNNSRYNNFRYVAYELVAGDNRKRQVLAGKTRAAPATDVAGKAPGTASAGGVKSARTRRSSFPPVRLTMNPSPPATSNLSF